jgi:1-acyl-sn-glycerol-3-phosphate acyltransferase
MSRIESLLYRIACRLVPKAIVRRHLAGVEGLQYIPREGAFVLVANHSSFFDHFLLATLIRVVRGDRLWFLTKDESFSSRSSRLFHRSLGAIPVDRDKVGPETLRRIKAVLRGGGVLCVYPEGTRGPGWPLAPFHSGAARFAAREGVAIVPAGISGAERVLPKGVWRPRPERARVAFGPPMHPDWQLSPKAQAEELTVQLKGAVERLTLGAMATSLARSQAAAQHTAAVAESRIDELHEETGAPDRDVLRQIEVLLMLATQSDPECFNTEVQQLRLRGSRALAARPPRRQWLGLGIGREARRLLELDKSDPMVRYILGRWHMSAPAAIGARRLDGVHHLMAASDSAPTDPRYRMALAEALVRAGRPEEADRLIDDVVLLSSTDTRGERRVQRAQLLRARVRNSGERGLSEADLSQPDLSQPLVAVGGHGGDL